jgi:hypothetical protein
LCVDKHEDSDSINLRPPRNSKERERESEEKEEKRKREDKESIKIFYLSTY